MAQCKRAFTLIELLVVIAIIALLISILLPALKNARASAQLTMSMSNLRQINAAAGSYRNDFRNFFPLIPTMSQRGTGTTILGWCTWSYGGKNPDGYWYNYEHADVLAADRPLNPYVYSDIDFDAPARPLRLVPAAPQRKSLELFVYRSPFEKQSHQRQFRQPTPPGMSNYDDIGTSYHFNVKWWERTLSRAGQLPGAEPLWVRAFRMGASQLAVGSDFEPARMVWISDEVADLVITNNDSRYVFVNGIGDRNKSVMGFADGHVAYHTVFAGNGPNSYVQPQYTFWFPQLYNMN